MSTRRSARLRVQLTQEPMLVPDATADEGPKKRTKRRVLATKNDKEPASKRKKNEVVSSESGVQPPAKARKKDIGAGVTKTSKSTTCRPANTTSDALSSLPAEVLNMILKNVDDTKSLGNLSATSKSYYALVTPQLYKRIDVYVTSHPQIAKFIRNLDPLLSIKQREQLKTEGTYKGQRESFSNKLDPKKVPELASFVTEAMFGIGDPGRKHRYIVHRYMEEAMKNMKNLEIVETLLVTESIANSLAQQKNLKALSLTINGLAEGDLTALSKIKGLSHLFISLLGFGHPDAIEDEVGVSLILNSRSTLRSLNIKTGSFASFLLDGLAKRAKVKGTGKILTALESLSFAGASFDEDIKDILPKAVDLAALKQLKIDYQSRGVEFLHRCIGDVLSKAHEDVKTDIKLRHLTLDMADDGWNTEPGEQEASLNAKIHLVSSFDTLTILDLHKFGQYPESQPEPGINPSLIQAIMKHQGLIKLTMAHDGIHGGCAIPHWHPHDVANIIADLPNLQELTFSTSAFNFEEIGKILSEARNLASVNISTVKTWAIDRANATESKSLLRGIALGVMERDLDSDVEVFNWEDHSALKLVNIDGTLFELGLKLGKTKKALPKKVGKFTVDLKPKREMLYRETTPARQTYRYALDPAWTNQVARDLGRA
ncbi:Ff.00g112390.m01.CDS01 [Fusarium sp. VM40]|nr:Ff.00g112390.m01.CDS01 [Fusarium sp. VM40]